MDNMKILVTGADGFIAKNLLVHLRQKQEINVVAINRTDSKDELKKHLTDANIIFHLAGVNRPKTNDAFETDNKELTSFIVEQLEQRKNFYKLIFSSSTQALLDNPYGKSKKEAEDYIRSFVKNGSAVIYRLPGVFGKWCKPNYNSVVATFCYNVAHHLPLQVNDPNHLLKIVYVDDVVHSLVNQLNKKTEAGKIVDEEVGTEYQITLGKLAQTIESFQTNRQTLFVPDVGNALEKALYSTWLTYLPENDFSYSLELKTDNRGSLFELLKSKNSGQIFISTTLPGITRGNHYHHTKTEKFVVIQGEGLIQFRSVLGKDVIEYKRSG